MGADLFESVVGSNIAAIQLADSPGRSVSDPVWIACCMISFGSQCYTGLVLLATTHVETVRPLVQDTVVA